MTPCNQCLETCKVYEDRWCDACSRRGYCKIRKNKTVAHRIQDGCDFDCTDIRHCTDKEKYKPEGDKSCANCWNRCNSRCKNCHLYDGLECKQSTICASCVDENGQPSEWIELN